MWVSKSELDMEPVNEVEVGKALMPMDIEESDGVQCFLNE